LHRILNAIEQICGVIEFHQALISEIFLQDLTADFTGDYREVLDVLAIT
jgi:hypothetical protein